MIIEVQRDGFTWNFMNVNFRTKEAYSIYIQFSLQEPWLFPKYDPHFSNLDIPLYGWLFFYFGRQTEGILYKTEDEDAKFSDLKGNRYHLFIAKERQMKDDIRKAVKKKAIFEVEETIKEDGVKHLKLIAHC